MSILADQAIATQIRDCRVAKGLSQAELAAELGVSQAAIGQWERGAAKPRSRHILAMSKFFERTIGSTVDQEASPSSTGQEDIYKILRRAGKQGHELKSEDFEEELHSLLRARLPGIKRNGTIQTPNGVKWILDICAEGLHIQVKHPATLQAAAGGQATAAALFAGAARRAQFGPGWREIVVVHIPALPDDTSLFAADVLKHSLDSMALNASVLNVKLIMAVSAVDAARQILQLLDADEE